MGVKMVQGPNATGDQMFSGGSMRVAMSLRRSMGGRSVKAPFLSESYLLYCNLLKMSLDCVANTNYPTLFHICLLQNMVNHNFSIQVLSVL
jgi:hypothetical protein